VSLQRCDPNRLCQGDVYRLPLAMPLATTEIVLVEPNVADGDLPSAVPRHGVRMVPPGPQLPGASGGSGAPELGVEYPVAVYAYVVDYFMVGSQTCDISGPGRGTRACVVPYFTLGQVLASQTVPVTRDDGSESSTTIVDRLEREFGADFSGVSDIHMDLPARVRDFVRERLGVETKQHQKTLRQVLNAINQRLLNPGMGVYYLPEARDLEFPEGYADLRQVYTMSLDELETHSDKRLASLAGSYREEFGRALGDLLSRVAVEEPRRAPSG